MKFLLATVIVVSLFANAWSITCYRCGGAAPSCKTAGSETVECDGSFMPNAVFACQVYTVNYTTLNKALEFKSCCLYEDCNKNPCDDFKNTVCSKMASCQSDKCNSDYDTAKAAQRPTLPSTATRVVFYTLASLVVVLAVAVVL